MPALLTSNPSSVLPRARWGRNHSPDCTDEKTEAGSGQWLTQDHTAEESRSVLLQVLPTLCSLVALLWTHLGALQSPFPTVTAVTTHQAPGAPCIELKASLFKPYALWDFFFFFIAKVMCYSEQVENGVVQRQI